MRYGNATMFCMLAVGVVWGLSGGCGSSGSPSVFETGSGGPGATSTTTGGISTGTGSTAAGIMTTGVGTGGITTGGSSTGTGGGDACSTQASDSNSIPSDL